MAYRGHKRGDIDGQSDIAFLISSLLSLFHTRRNTHTHTHQSPSFSTIFLLFYFTSAPSHSARTHFSPLSVLSFKTPSSLFITRVSCLATDHLDGTPPSPLPPVSSAAAVRSLCPCLQTPACFTNTPNSYNHFTGSDKRRVSSV